MSRLSEKKRIPRVKGVKACAPPRYHSAISSPRSPLTTRLAHTKPINNREPVRTLWLTLLIGITMHAEAISGRTAELRQIAWIIL